MPLYDQSIINYMYRKREKVLETEKVSERMLWGFSCSEYERPSTSPNSFSPADCAEDKCVLKAAGNKHVSVWKMGQTSRIKLCHMMHKLLFFQSLQPSIAFQEHNTISSSTAGGSSNKYKYKKKQFRSTGR